MHPFDWVNTTFAAKVSRCSFGQAIVLIDASPLGSIHLNSEPWVARLISHSMSGRVDAFRDAVRARDGKCVVSGIVNVRAPWNTWSGFEAAHVFPLDCESVWIEFDYERWITDMDGVTGTSRINSIQNGLLLRGDLHSDFDNYLFSINPDVSNYPGNKTKSKPYQPTWNRTAIKSPISVQIHLDWMAGP